MALIMIYYCKFKALADNLIEVLLFKDFKIKLNNLIFLNLRVAIC